MRILLILVALTTLLGCETVGDIIREKRYTLQIHETPYSRQMFGYNTDYGYIGFMMSSSFGNPTRDHMHNGYCDHTFENSFK